METEQKQSFWEVIRFSVIAILIIIPVRVFIAQPFVVSGASMFPTFMDKDYLIVDEFTYRFVEEPKRNEVIVFRYPNDTKKFFIKRIIGLPNEIVDINGEFVTITNKESGESFQLEQPFVENKSYNQMHFELKETEYFVMGDNRAQSSDSRYWGPLERDLIVGRAFLRLWPVKEAGVFPGLYTQSK